MSSLRKFIPQKQEKLIEVIELDSFSIISNMTGLISVYSEWSSQSVMNAAQILGILDKGQLDEFQVYFLNSDKIAPAEQKEILGFVSHGFFESAWVEKGQVVKSFQRKNEYEEFVEFLDQQVNQNTESNQRL